MKKSLFYFFFAVVLLGGMIGARSMLAYHPVPASQTKVIPTIVTYTGRDGANAFDLLATRHHIQTDASGLVTRIDAVKADTTKHEYWAFYVNNKLSSVGPKDYLTTSKDNLSWKIETY